MQPKLVPLDRDSANPRYVCKAAVCPFKGAHARNGNEFALGCGKCHAGED
jgi:hypothetical protein